MSRKEQLRARAVKLGAMDNYLDALIDLEFWSEHRKQILDDLEGALDAHEAEQVRAERGGMSR